jgi:osmotically-inducible protein OsmY
MTVAKRKSSTDDKVEAKRKIIRRSLDEITAEVTSKMRGENLHSSVNIVVPSRHSLVTIAGPCDSSSEERSRLSSIVCEVIGQKLGREGLRGRPLAHATATAKLSAATVTPD